MVIVKMDQHFGPILQPSNEEAHDINSTSSSDDCIVIGTYKPPTPEIIDLSTDDDEPSPSLLECDAEKQRITGKRRRAHSEETVDQVDLHTEKTTDVTIPDILNAYSDSPHLKVEAESESNKRKVKKRHHMDMSRLRSNTSETSVLGSQPDQNARRDWSDTDSVCNPKKRAVGNHATAKFKVEFTEARES